MVNDILEKIPKSVNVEIKKSICNATDLRQAEAKVLASKVDLMIVIGGKNSSNTKKLYDISKENCKSAIHIETKDELDSNFLKQFENVGIIAGASTPESIIQEVVDFCNEV